MFLATMTEAVKAFELNMGMERGDRADLRETLLADATQDLEERIAIGSDFEKKTL
jgi:hypothetical protein